MSDKRVGRVAGALYLLFGVLYVLGASLAAHASSTSATFRAAVGIELLGNIAFIATAIALFVLLRHVNELAARVMVVLVVLASGVGYAEVVAQYTAHIAASPAGEMEASSLFSGLWLLPLAYLVLKSGSFPRFVGVLLLIAAAGWLLQFSIYFFAPGLSVNVAVFRVLGIGELVFIAWLLLFSVRPSRVEVTP